MRRVLLTGSTGFIGTVLKRRLQSIGVAVESFSRADFAELRKSWRRGLAALAARNPHWKNIDAVVHLAGIAHTHLPPEQDYLYHEVNVVNTRLLLDFAERIRCRRFIFFSSVLAANAPQNRIVDETCTALPKTAYGLSKRTAEHLVLTRCEQSGMHGCVIRPSLVYGPGVKGNLRRLLDFVAKDHRLRLVPAFGDKRSMVSVDDLSEAVILALHQQAASGQIFIVSDGIDYSLCDIVAAVAKIRAFNCRRIQVPTGVLALAAKAGDAFEAVSHRHCPFNSNVCAKLMGGARYRSDKIAEALGWSPRKTLYGELPSMMAALG